MGADGASVQWTQPTASDGAYAMSELEILDLVRASARADGSEARPYSRHGGNSPIGTADPSISADGSKVAFTSDFLDLIPNDTNGNSDIFVKNFATGAIERANTTADGAPSETGSPLTLPEMVAGGPAYRPTVPRSRSGVCLRT